MDESHLQDRLSQIEQRQYLILILLVIPYLIGIAVLIGVWIAGVLYTVVGLLFFAMVAFYRRRNRSAAGQ